MGEQGASWGLECPLARLMADCWRH